MQNMKGPYWQERLGKAGRYLVITGVILFFASLAGVIATRALPDTVEESVNLLQYEHQGKFDYRAYQKASYLFGDIPLETEEARESPEPTKIPWSPPSTVKYPVGVAERFDMTFAYELVPGQNALVAYSEQVEVKAVLNKPDEEPEEIILVPLDDKNGPFSVSFSLDATRLSLSPATTVTANVYATVETATGMVFERFSHTLMIQSIGHYLEVDTILGSSQWTSLGDLSYEQNGEFNYSVLLKQDSPWGPLTIMPPSIEPPQPPPPEPPPIPALSSIVLGPGDIIFPQLIDNIEATFSYELKSNQPIRQAATDVEIDAVLEASKLWSRRFPLLQTKESGSFEVSLPLDLDYYLEALETIRAETGASAESYSLAIIANVHATAMTDYGPINEVFSQTLSTELGSGTLEWQEDFQKAQPGSIQETRTLPNTNRYSGLSVGGVRVLSSALSGFFFLFSALAVVVYVRYRPPGPSSVDKEVERINKKYATRMSFATGRTKLEGERQVSLGSMEDLVKIADELGRPIIHQAPARPQETHTYYILDGLTRYRYLISPDSPGDESNPKMPEQPES